VANITLMVAKEVRNFNIIPRIALLKLFKFRKQQFTRSKIDGRSEEKLLNKEMPLLIVDGEMQASVAFN
jgi:malate dehydrogenase (oxaloacetate-decarboxylating)(NADP+)